MRRPYHRPSAREGTATRSPAPPPAHASAPRQVRTASSAAAARTAPRGGRVPWRHGYPTAARCDRRRRAMATGPRRRRGAARRRGVAGWGWGRSSRLARSRRGRACGWAVTSRAGKARVLHVGCVLPVARRTVACVMAGHGHHAVLHLGLRLFCLHAWQLRGVANRTFHAACCRYIVEWRMMFCSHSHTPQALAIVLGRARSLFDWLNALARGKGRRGRVPVVGA
jgi:hypothetical protein